MENVAMVSLYVVVSTLVTLCVGLAVRLNRKESRIARPDAGALAIRYRAWVLAAQEVGRLSWGTADAVTNAARVELLARADFESALAHALDGARTGVTSLVLEQLAQLYGADAAAVAVEGYRDALMRAARDIPAHAPAATEAPPVLAPA